MSDWTPEIDELNLRREMAERMGGEEKVTRQHSRGKMDARARLAAIVDPGSFREIGKIAGRGSYDADGNLVDLAASNFIFGRANVNGRPVVASADDFTVRGGRLVVFGSGDLIANARIANVGNQSVFLNAVNWTVDQDTQLNIPARPIERFQLSLSANDLAKLRYTLLFALPGVAALLGLAVYWTRRH